jgi:hypothetical protein
VPPLGLNDAHPDLQMLLGQVALGLHSCFWRFNRERKKSLLGTNGSKRINLESIAEEFQSCWKTETAYRLGFVRCDCCDHTVAIYGYEISATSSSWTIDKRRSARLYFVQSLQRGPVVILGSKSWPSDCKGHEMGGICLICV